MAGTKVLFCANMRVLDYDNESNVNLTLSTVSICLIPVEPVFHLRVTICNGSVCCK